jgi:hypothetical protein
VRDVTYLRRATLRGPTSQRRPGHQALCDRLVANDAVLTELQILLDRTYDANLKLILDAARKNKTVKKVLLDGSIFFDMHLSVPAALTLASVVSEHPEIQEIGFIRVKFIEFGPIALAIQQSRKLTRLLFRMCRLSPNLVGFRWLLTENALESMTLVDNISYGEPSFDVSGALIGNSSLKKLVLHDPYGALGSETFQAIPHFIRTNQDFETLDLILADTMTDRYEVLRLVAQAAEGHASLNKLAIAYSGESYNEPFAEELINRDLPAEAIGTMLHNARPYENSPCPIAT